MQTDNSCKWLIGVSRPIGCASLLVLSLLSIACEQKAQPNSEAADRMFSKKLECEKLLAHLEGSALGPTPETFPSRITMPPLVFYSPTLNSCVERTESLVMLAKDESGNTVTGNDVHTVHVEDLLTGEYLASRTFHESVPAEADEYATFDDDLMETYGAQPDKTLPRRHKP